MNRRAEPAWEVRSDRTASIPRIRAVTAPGDLPEGGIERLAFVPNPVRAGSVVTMRITGCGGLAVGTVDAASIGAGVVLLGPGARSDEAFGHVDVPPTVRPGSYTLNFADLDGASASGVLRVRRESGD